MSDKDYHLSEAVLNEEAADLAFKRIMAVYCEVESKKILEEMKEREGDKKQETVDVRKIDKLISSCENKDNAKHLFSVSKKVFAWVASVVLICGLSITSAVVASADAREYVFELAMVEMEKYTDIQIVRKDSFEEEFFAEAEYIPTYVPAGYILDKSSCNVDKNTAYIKYVNGNKKIFFEYCKADSANTIQIDTENAYQSKNIEINNNPATVYYKDYLPNEVKYIIWQNNDSVFVIRSNAELDILINFAEGISENEGKIK
ncbi:MAG: DUF4367 domain-containing protein [Oscillospiraceae bacterium]|nr:DUF4367 domain-containing protein [Oscillospiraceae bacterium]